MENKIYKIYGLEDPFTNELRYVGQTFKKLRERLNGHVGRKEISYKRSWILSLRAINNTRPNIFLMEIIDNAIK